jgi:hypothetical protein
MKARYTGCGASIVLSIVLTIVLNLLLLGAPAARRRHRARPAAVPLPMLT